MHGLIQKFLLQTRNDLNFFLRRIYKMRYIFIRSHRYLLQTLIERFRSSLLRVLDDMHDQEKAFACTIWFRFLRLNFPLQQFCFGCSSSFVRRRRRRRTTSSSAAKEKKRGLLSVHNADKSSSFDFDSIKRKFNLF